MEKIDMNLDLAPLSILVFGVSILIMLLPALLELKRPKDAGPREIMRESDQAIAKSLVLLTTIEEKMESDPVLAKKVADILAALPSLDE